MESSLCFRGVLWSVIDINTWNGILRAWNVSVCEIPLHWFSFSASSSDIIIIIFLWWMCSEWKLVLLNSHIANFRLVCSMFDYWMERNFIRLEDIHTLWALLFWMLNRDQWIVCRVETRTLLDENRRGEISFHEFMVREFNDSTSSNFRVVRLSHNKIVWKFHIIPNMPLFDYQHDRREYASMQQVISRNTNEKFRYQNVNTERIHCELSTNRKLFVDSK